MRRIEVHHLDRKRRATTDRTFPVRWFSPAGPGPTDIIASCIVAGADADYLISLFEAGFKPIEDDTLCGHYPNYGIRWIEDDALVLETTVCLSCGNWIGTAAGVAERYQIGGGVFRELSAQLQHHLPLSLGEF